jgi:hypothetical protein
LFDQSPAIARLSIRLNRLPADQSALPPLNFAITANSLVGLNSFSLVLNNLAPPELPALSGPSPYRVLGSICCTRFPVGLYLRVRISFSPRSQILTMLPQPFRSRRAALGLQERARDPPPAAELPRRTGPRAPAVSRRQPRSCPARGHRTRPNRRAESRLFGRRRQSHRCLPP